MEWMLHRKRRETKQQPSMFPGLAVPGCCLVSFCFLCDIHTSTPSNLYILNYRSKLAIIRFDGYPYYLNWHFWSRKRSRKWGQSQRSMTSSTASRVSWFTTPGKTTYSMAFRTIVRFDLLAGSRYSRVPSEKRDVSRNCNNLSPPTHFDITVLYGAEYALHVAPSVNTFIP